MSHRGKAHSGICAIAVASLLCGSNAALRPLGAQPLPQMADQPPDDSGASFDARFSSGGRTQPVFTYPEIQSLIASLPPLEPPPDAPTAIATSEAPAPDNTASLPVQEPNAAIAATSPSIEILLPDFPPPPEPADVVLPSQEELAAARPEAPAPSAMSGASRTETMRRAEAPRVTRSQERADTRRKAKSSAQNIARLKSPAATGSLADCRTGTACASPPQTFALIFGFIAGALLGGPVGAIAGAMMGAAATAPDAPQTSRPDPARR